MFVVSSKLPTCLFVRIDRYQSVAVVEGSNPGVLFFLSFFVPFCFSTHFDRHRVCFHNRVPGPDML